jgi:toxin ParE1/3/4
LQQINNKRYARAGRVKNTRELVVSGLPFLIIYRFLSEKSTVQMLRVLHEKKRWS